jgi:NADH pyrophosphatase NudC (nudix superfamily)
MNEDIYKEYCPVCGTEMHIYRAGQNVRCMECNLILRELYIDFEPTNGYDP